MEVVVTGTDTTAYIELIARLQDELVAARADRDGAQAERDAAQAEREAMRAVLDELRAEVAQLKARLGQNSSNSHRPPSTDPPGARKPPKKKPTGRKKGGQRGRLGRSRVLLPTEEATQVVPCKPSHCAGCGVPLAGDDATPERHQVTEIPKVAPIVVEYQVHALRCPCGAVTHGRLPAGVTYSAFGPRLQALVVMLSAVYRLSKRNIQRLMQDYLSIDLSIGSISKLEASMSRALEQPVEEAKALAREQPVAHADETGWREGKSKAWLWTVVTSVVVIFAVRLSRGAKVAKELLGEQYAGLLVSDRWSGYRWVDITRRQLCWAHLIRDFQKLADSRGLAVAIGKALGEQAKLLFHAWHQVRDGTWTRARFQAEVEQTIRPEVRRLLTQGASMPKGSDRRGMCAALLAAEPALWTFVSVEGVEPTNNVAERTVRHGVLWRRTSFGTQSQTGSRFVERMLTTVATLRLRRRHVLDYLTAVCDAANRGKSAPSLFGPLP
ncbi:MAG: IS66 family transposase [Trueperaceae bacterium]|nr:IS66 family transposase [Trueperaceae bacterium]